MDEHAMRQLVTESRVGRLATVGPGGRPHVVPFCYAVSGDVLYSMVDEKPKSTHDLARLRNIRTTPAVEVVVDQYDEDWTEVWWVRLRGNARVVESGAEWDRALSLLTAKYPQYVVAPPRGAAVVVEIDRWTGWSAAP